MYREPVQSCSLCGVASAPEALSLHADGAYRCQPCEEQLALARALMRRRPRDAREPQLISTTKLIVWAVVSALGLAIAVVVGVGLWAALHGH